jgi:hypothetical protein
MLKAHFFTQVLAKHNNIYLGDWGQGHGGGHRCCLETTTMTQRWWIYETTKERAHIIELSVCKSKENIAPELSLSLVIHKGEICSKKQKPAKKYISSQGVKGGMKLRKPSKYYLC